MRLLFNLFSVLALTSRPHARPLFAVATGLGFAGNDKMPKDMFYGMYDNFPKSKTILCSFD